MVETIQDPQRIKAQFKRRRLYLWLLLGLMALVLVAVVALDQGPGRAILGVPPVAWIALLVASFAATLFYSLRYWRCPACNKWFGQAQFMRHCPGCGVELS